MLSVETSRLYLREFLDKDREAYAAILQDPSTMEHWPAPFDEEGLDRWFARAEHHQGSGLGRWMVILKESNEVIGDCGIWESEVNGRPEFDLGYIFHRDHWGQGYALEACQAYLAHAFRHTQLERVVANMAESHPRSARVAEKLGMVLESTFVNPRNRGYRHKLYVMTRDQYQEQRRRKLIDQLADDPEKANWLTLATSEDLQSRMLALETAAGIRDSIQKELLFWFFSTPHFHLRQRLFDLLNPHNQNLVRRSVGHGELKPLNEPEAFAWFMAAEEAVEEDILCRILGAGGGLPEHKMLFMRQYQQATGAPLGKARDVLLKLAEKARDYS